MSGFLLAGPEIAKQKQGKALTINEECLIQAEKKVLPSETLFCLHSGVTGHVNLFFFCSLLVLLHGREEKVLGFRYLDR